VILICELTPLYDFTQISYVQLSIQDPPYLLSDPAPTEFPFHFKIKCPPINKLSNNLMFVQCIIRRSRNNQRYSLICTTPLLYTLAPTCFGCSLKSSGSFLDASELLEIQIEWVVYHDTPAHRPRNHKLYNIPPIRFVFQVTQKDLVSSLMMAGYCRNI
jgi:hypothetical protein